MAPNSMIPWALNYSTRFFIRILIQAIWHWDLILSAPNFDRDHIDSMSEKITMALLFANVSVARDVNSSSISKLILSWIFTEQCTRFETN